MRNIRVEVDITDYIEHYIDISVDISEFRDSDLIKEITSRNINIHKTENGKIEDLKRHLCDIVECGYHTESVEILKRLAKKIV